MTVVLANDHFLSFNGNSCTFFRHHHPFSRSPRAHTPPPPSPPTPLPPPEHTQVRQLQKSVEDIRINIQSKRKSAALDDLKKAKGIINAKETKMTSSCRDAKVCSDILASMKEEYGPLEGLLKASADSLNGSDQEREALDKSYDAQDRIQKKLTDLEEQMIPAGE